MIQMDENNKISRYPLGGFGETIQMSRLDNEIRIGNYTHDSCDNKWVYIGVSGVMMFTSCEIDGVDCL